MLPAAAAHYMECQVCCERLEKENVTVLNLRVSRVSQGALASGVSLHTLSVICSAYYGRTLGLLHL